MARHNYNESVRNRIIEYQNKNEVLITYLQLVIIGLITIFYILAPKGFAGLEVVFQPVPYALGGWFAVLLVRFIVAYTRHMRGAWVYIFILIDVVLLLGLIYSYSVQYQAPTALSLKAPTFIFLLFFIFLRSLRFEVRHVIFGCICGIVGWWSLVYVAYTDSPITRNFLEYTTANSLLFGAEIEKTLALIVCTLVVGLMVRQSQKILVLSHQQRDVVRNLSLFFSQNVVKRIASENEAVTPGRGEERNGVIMSIDIRGFTAFSASHSVSEVMDTISAYQQRIISVVREHSGSIDKFMGDGILIHFGIADDSPQYAASALRAAEQIFSTIEKWNKEREAHKLDPVNIGIGMDGGRVVFGTVGDENRLEFTVIGNAVNTATKLEKATKEYPGSILVTKETYDLARTQGYNPTYIPFLIKKQNIAASTQSVTIVTLLTARQKAQLDSVPVGDADSKKA